MSQELDSIRGTIEGVAHHNPDTGWTVARLRMDDRAETVSIVGLTVGVAPGESVILRGAWERHSQYGLQFRFREYEPLRPSTLDALTAYLGSGVIKGVGPSLARAIVAHFGDETLDVLDNHGERLRCVPGIGSQRAAAVQETWRQNRQAHNAMLFLQRLGISGALAARIYQQYGGRAIEVIERNPYRLAAEVRGIGFLTADRIGQRSGISREDPARLQAGVLHVLQDAVGQGHLFLQPEVLVGSATRLLGVDRELVEVAVAALEESGETQTEDGERVWLPELLATEKEIARRLLQARAHPPSEAPTRSRLEAWLADRALFGDLELTPEQAEAVGLALASGVCVITGGPGTGKTTVVRALTDAWEAMGKRVGLACPTGRAAKRLEQLSGKPASTIHRLLSYDPVRHAFRYDANNQLPLDALVIDESSMVDVLLARDLLRALRPGAQLVLVGDADQLPSVGPGAFLRDVVSSGAIPVCQLTKIHRQQQGSLIVRNAHAINRGDPPVLLDRERWRAARDDCIFLERETPEQVADLVIDTVTRALPRMGFAPADIQVLSPMHRGAIGVGELNRRLQETLNPPHPGSPELARGETSFRLGDRVLQSVNNYDKGVYNGDIGYIIAVDRERDTCVIEYDQGPVSYYRSELVEVELAYALTVHKSQGSEYPACVIVMHTSHYIMLQRNLLYTALTRAQRMACILGERRAIFKAINTVSGSQRNTHLAQRLRDAASLQGGT